MRRIKGTSSVLSMEWDAVTSSEQLGIPGLKLMPSRCSQETYWVGDGSPEWEKRAVVHASLDNPTTQRRRSNIGRSLKTAPA